VKSRVTTKANGPPQESNGPSRALATRLPSSRASPRQTKLKKAS